MDKYRYFIGSNGAWCNQLFTNKEVSASSAYLGFPKYFYIELEIAKVLGAIALLLPMIPARIKEWAYAGFFILFISAFVAHLSVGDPIWKIMKPVVFIGIGQCPFSIISN